MSDRMPILATYGEARSPEHRETVRVALDEVMDRLNRVPGEYAADAISSVMLTFFLNQIDPIAVFEFIVSQVGVAILRNLNEQPVGHA